MFCELRGRQSIEELSEEGQATCSAVERCWDNEVMSSEDTDLCKCVPSTGVGTRVGMVCAEPSPFLEKALEGSVSLRGTSESLSDAKETG